MADFDDGKDAGALRTIGELGVALGIKAHVLRYWEDQFPQLQPLKRSGGRRYYRPDDVALVREIDRLINREGYTIRGARTALMEFNASDSRQPQAPAQAIAQPASMASLAAVPADAVARLRAIRSRLAEALAS